MGKALGSLVSNRYLAGSLLWLVVAMVALLVTIWDLRTREQVRLSLLETEAQRSGIEVMSQTLNGNLMGSITLLGLIDGDIKQEAVNGLLSVDAHIAQTISTLGNSFSAEGVFVVGEDGIVKTSWDRINKPSTGLDVRFRPYYQMAMRGKASVYAAVSMARGDRSLYFSAPIYAERARSTSGVGAIVARTDLSRVEALFREKFDVALLLSPQGVVFVSSRPEWVGFIEGSATPERLKSIRELKQFGAMFEEAIPQSLPLQSVSGIQTVGDVSYAVASTNVQWNDPSGDWKLVVMEDLGRALPLQPSLEKGALSGAMALVLGWMLLHLLRSRQAQTLAHLTLQTLASEQEANVEQKTRLATLSVRLQRSTGINELAQTFLSEARDMMKAPQGVVYVQESFASTQLILAASSASASEVPPALEPGEGLLGQCAIEGQICLINLVDDGYWNLRSGLGNCRAAALLVAPVVLQGRTLGVLELALLVQPDAAAMQKFEEMVAIFAMNLEILRRHTPATLPNHATDALEVSE